MRIPFRLISVPEQKITTIGLKWAPVVIFQTPFGGVPPRADQASSHGYKHLLPYPGIWMAVVFFASSFRY